MNLDDPRPPAVSGLFYPSDRDGLLKAIHESFVGRFGPGAYPQTRLARKLRTKSIECFVVPHAGYVYSGPIAAHSYFKASELMGTENAALTIVILGPNHYGIGSGIALSPNRSWKTPLGNLQVDSDLSKRILSSCDLVDSDAIAHSREHSIEVQLPFIQSVLSPPAIQISFVPISLMIQDQGTMIDLAAALSKVLGHLEDRSLVVLASSDLTHYEPKKVASAQDKKLLDVVETLDVSEYYTVLERNNVSACGYGAIACVMQMARNFGKEKGSILKYATSGDITGDESSVVGYSSVYFS